MATSQTDLPARRKPARSPVIVRVSTAFSGVGSIGGVIYVLFARQVPFTAQAGVFENVLAIIMLIAAATTVLTLLTYRIIRSRLSCEAAKLAVRTVQSNEDALRTFSALDASLSWRRWIHGLPDEEDKGDKGDKDGKGGKGNKKNSEDDQGDRGGELAQPEGSGPRRPVSGRPGAGTGR